MIASTTPILFAVLSSLCFALGLVFAQRGLRHAQPYFGALMSVPTSTTLLWLLSPWLIDWHAFVPTSAAIFAGIGVIFPAAVMLLTFQANRQMGANVAGALGNLAPLFALLLAALMFGEVPRPVQAIGVAAILAGVIVLSMRRSGDPSVWPWWVVVFPIAAAAIRGVIQPISKFGLIDWPNPFAAALIGYSVSSLVILATNIVHGTLVATLRRQSATGFFWFFLVGCCNLSAVLLLYAALAQGSVTLVSPLVATYPLLTLPLSLAFLQGEQLTARLFIGVALTVTGVVILIAV